MKKFLALLALLLPLPATAAPPSFLDLYYVPSAELEQTGPLLPTTDEDGDGFGIRSMTPISEGAVIIGEYQKTSYDDSDTELKQLRLGLGFTGETGSGVLLEYVKADSGLFDGGKADGFAVHGRLAGTVSDTISYFGQLGHLSVKDDAERNKGLEYSAGIAVAISRTTGLLLDYRRTRLKGADSDAELELGEFRIGLRFVP